MLIGNLKLLFLLILSKAFLLLLLSCNKNQSNQSSHYASEKQNTSATDIEEKSETKQTELEIKNQAIALQNSEELASKVCDASSFGRLFYIASEDLFYICDETSSSFIAVNIKGEQGDAGGEGIGGTPGLPGATGLPGKKGEVGGKGEQGEKGESNPPFTTSTNTLLSPFINTVIVEGRHYIAAHEENYLSFPFANAVEMFITTSSGCSNPVWIPYEAVTRFPLSSQTETTLYFKFRDVNRVESICYQSDATITLDDTPPAIGSFAFSDQINGVANLTSTPAMSWSAEMNDVGSGLKTYQIAIGTSQGAKDALDWTDINQASSPYTHSGLNLDYSKSYVLSIRAVDQVGNIGPELHRAPFTTLAEGALDSSFYGVGHRVLTANAGAEGDDKAFGITTDSFGRMLAVGIGLNGTGDTDGVILRFNLDGSLDTSFFGNGDQIPLKNLNRAATDDQANAVAIDSKNRILVAGISESSATSNSDAALWRLWPDGSPDFTFGVNSIAVHDGAAGVSDSIDRINAIAVDAGDHIIAVGQSGSDAVIWKYDDNGSLESNFDGDGFRHFTAGESFAAVAIASDGDIIAVGTTDASHDVYIVKVNPSGVLDSGFDGDGVLQLSDIGGAGDDFAYGVITDKDGKIVITGTTTGSTTQEIFVSRINLDGSLDPSFGGGDGSINVFQAGSINNEALSIAEDALGNLIVSGSIQLTDKELALWRFDSAGNLDTNFATAGFYSMGNIAGGDSHDLGIALALDHQDRICVAAQSVGLANEDFAVLRIK